MSSGWVGNIGIMHPNTCPREHVPTRLLSQVGSQAFGREGKDIFTRFSSWCTGRGQSTVGLYIGIRHLGQDVRAGPVETSLVNKHSNFPGLRLFFFSL